MKYLIVLLLASCSTVPPTIKPQPPQVQCKQIATQSTPTAPRADGWVEDFEGAARLSKEAVVWIAQVLGIVDKERELRKAEDLCLDGYEKENIIRQ